MAANDDEALMDPPHYDMLTVKFYGDEHSITLPYCEVANGTIKSIDKDKLTIVMPGGTNQSSVISFEEFIKFTEKVFDIKEIVRLDIQRAGDYNKYNI